jgi:hypothetical protein
MKRVVVRQNDASCDMNFGERASFSVHRVSAVKSFLLRAPPEAAEQFEETIRANIAELSREVAEAAGCPPTAGRSRGSSGSSSARRPGAIRSASRRWWRRRSRT